MKRTMIAAIALVSLALPVKAQEVSKYTAINAAIEVFTESFCNAARLGANRTEAMDAALNDSFVYLKNIGGEDFALNIFKSMDKKRFAYSAMRSVAQSCLPEFIGTASEDSLPY